VLRQELLKELSSMHDRAEANLRGVAAETEALQAKVRAMSWPLLNQCNLI
jgi:hypothetical protein